MSMSSRPGDQKDAKSGSPDLTLHTGSALTEQEIYSLTNTNVVANLGIDLDEKLRKLNELDPPRPAKAKQAIAELNDAKTQIEQLKLKLGEITADIAQRKAAVAEATAKNNANQRITNNNAAQLKLRNSQWNRLQRNYERLPSRIGIDYDEMKAQYDQEKIKLEGIFATWGVKPGHTGALGAAPAAITIRDYTPEEILAKLKPHAILFFGTIKPTVDAISISAITQSVAKAEALPPAYDEKPIVQAMPGALAPQSTGQAESVVVVVRPPMASSTDHPLSTGTAAAVIPTAVSKSSAAMFSQPSQAPLTLAAETLQAIKLLEASEILQSDNKLSNSEQLLRQSTKAQLLVLKNELENKSSTLSQQSAFFGCTLGSMSYFIQANKENNHVKKLVNLNQQWTKHYDAGLKSYMEKIVPSLLPAQSATAAKP